MARIKKVAKTKRRLRLKSDTDKIREKRIRLNKVKKINSYLFELCSTILIYGFLLNIAMATMFDYVVAFHTILGWGLVYYFVKFEVCERVDKSWTRLAKH